MSASASREDAVLAGRADRAGSGEERTVRLFWVEAALAVIAFAALCAVVLAVGAPHKGLEPDDGAYHLSIVAVTMGDFLTLSSAQLNAVETRVGDRTGLPNQWIELADGRYISEKDPGYPYLAAPLEALGIMQWAQLFYGALACLGLFIGARRWLGRFGGLAAVGLYRSSGAALLFAWRMYMPTVHRRLADRGRLRGSCCGRCWQPRTSTRRRTWPGLAGFAAHRDGDLRPLRGHRDPRLRRRRRGRWRGACRLRASLPHAVLVARLGTRLRRRRSHLR